MPLFDKKYKRHPYKYFFQCFLAMLTIMIMLFAMNKIVSTTIVGVFGATSFIIFTRPDAYGSSPRRLIGGYIVGIFFGCITSTLSQLPIFMGLFSDPTYSIAFFGGLTVFLSIFTMVVTDTEHPPASGLSLALILTPWTFKTIIFLLVVISGITLLKELFKKHMINLI